MMRMYMNEAGHELQSAKGYDCSGSHVGCVRDYGFTALLDLYCGVANYLSPFPRVALDQRTVLLAGAG